MPDMTPRAVGLNEPCMACGVDLSTPPASSCPLPEAHDRPFLTPGLRAEIERRLNDEGAQARRMATYCRGRRLIGIGTDAQIPCQLGEGHEGPHVYRSYWSDDDGDAVRNG